jgi:hypothetical protein
MLLPKLGLAGTLSNATGTALPFDHRILVGSPVVLSRPKTSDPKTFAICSVALMSWPPALQLART